MDSFFIWDEKKAESNLKNHGVSFEEAMTVFQDPLAYAFEDERHSVGERREIIIGYSGAFRLLVVSFTQRGDIFRIITARIATKRERKEYEEGAIS